MIRPITLLNAFAGFTPVLAFAAAVCCLATALAFAGVLAFAAVVSGLTAALALTIVLTFARVFSCIGIGETMYGSAYCIGGARSICPHSDGPGEEPGDCRSSDDRFGWFHGTIFFRVSGFDFLSFRKQESTGAWFLPFPVREFFVSIQRREIEWGEKTGALTALWAGR